jgi:hypothetical protein
VLLSTQTIEKNVLIQQGLNCLHRSITGSRSGLKVSSLICPARESLNPTQALHVQWMIHVSFGSMDLLAQEKQQLHSLLLKLARDLMFLVPASSAHVMMLNAVTLISSSQL